MHTISIEHLKSAMDRLSTALICETSEPSPRVTIRKCRMMGLENDYAVGLVEVDLQLAEGKMTLATPWTAEGQYNPEYPWFIQQAGHLDGTQIAGELCVLDEDGELLASDDEPLASLAFDFFSCLPFDEWVQAKLPARSAQAGRE